MDWIADKIQDAQLKLSLRFYIQNLIGHPYFNFLNLTTAIMSNLLQLLIVKNQILQPHRLVKGFSPYQ